MNKQALLEVIGAALHGITIAQPWHESAELNKYKKKTTYQNESEEHEGDEYWFDVAWEEIEGFLIFLRLICGGKALLIEHFLNQIVTWGIEEDCDKEHHKEHTEDDHAVETKKVDRGTESESHNAEA